MTLSELLAELDRRSGRISVLALVRLLQRASIEYDDVRRFVRFQPERYLRNLMHQGPASQALVLCWRNGQRSPIHDHRGSSCAVKVMQGVATETVFDRAPNGMVYPVSTRTLERGSICASEDADIHQLSNLQAEGKDLVTLHLYSPPLLVMNMYSLLDEAVSRYEDPINEEFISGSGI
jgi:cysteine dioxygenase